jgi:hypothetical protein
MKIVFFKIKSWMLVLLLSLFFAHFAVSQEKVKNPKELHFQLSGSSLNFDYKIAKSEQFAWSFSLVNLYFSYDGIRPNESNSFPSNYGSVSFAFQTGPEFRKQITDEIIFYHGPTLYLGSYISFVRVYNPSLPIASQRQQNVEYNARIPYVFGFQYRFAKRFSVSAEIAPALSFQYDPGEVDGGFHAPDSFYARFSAKNSANLSIVMHL